MQCIILLVAFDDIILFQSYYFTQLLLLFETAGATPDLQESIT
jgi:hypothetical protein